MIGIVIVSHSREISDGLKRMADAMGPTDVPVVSAGGMDDPENPLGTDALRIYQAIQDMLTEDGVLVFADIGAAKLNAETAIDLLDEDQKQKVRFCDAPLVEGVLSATVQSAADGSIDEVMREAQDAYTPPSVHVEPTAPEAKTPPHSEKALVREYDIVSPLGLHARPAARFVTAMNQYESDVHLRNVTKDSGYVNAKSINKVVTLEVVRNSRISVSAEGPDAAQVHESIQRLIEDNFGEGPTLPTPARVPAAARATERVEETAKIRKKETAADAAERRKIPATEPGPILRGIPISPGYAVGPARHLHTGIPEVEQRKVVDPDAEIDRFNRALDIARDEIEALMSQSRETIGDYEARIFEAHLLHLDDPEIAETVRERIRTEQINAEAAWRQTVEEMAEAYRALEDDLMRARGDDLIDVGTRVTHILLGIGGSAVRFDEPVILCIDRLRPSDVAALDLGQLRGICTESGSKTSHAGILASALSIPVVFGIGAPLWDAPEGRQVLLDGKEGTLNVRPDNAAIEKMEHKRDAWRVRRDQAERVKFDPAVTRDGHRRRVAANMADLKEMKNILDSGAEEVGLFRTEFLYMNRAQAPSEDEQYEIYRQIVARLEGRPLVIRTMDIGGDKPVPYLEQPHEANPNLGWRGLRYGLANRALLQTQLRAILRASAEGPVRIMFPMVSTADEVLAARREIEEVKAQLKASGHRFDAGTQIGIMVEVPAAAEMADRLSPHVDFFSIGTNDLTQYVMAADRGNQKVAYLFDPFQPAVLRTIQRTIEAAKQSGIWVGMCGAMAGDPMAMPMLLGLGLDEFSMTASQIPEFKLDFARLSLGDCRRLAQQTLTLDTAQQVRECISAFLEPPTV